MEQLGLNRIPYYSELAVFNRDEVNNDITSLVLSVLLYWQSKDKYVRFNARQHSYLLARNLRVSHEKVIEALTYLTSLSLLDKQTETITTKGDTPKEKLNEFYHLNFHRLKVALKEKGLDIPIKILRLASDDYFDLFSYLSPNRLPLVQGLVGMIKGDKYEEAALNVCKILVGICATAEYEDFSYKALAPGWRMLCQAPVTAEELVQRYLQEGERSVDIDLTDGSFFMPDGDYFGTEKHKIWHSGKAIEPRILASCMYLCFTAIDKEVSFYSDLTVTELKKAFELLYRFTNLKGRLDEVYFNYQDLQGDELTEAQALYQKILDSLH